MAPELLDLRLPEDEVKEETSPVLPTTLSDVYSFGGVMLQVCDVLAQFGPYSLKYMTRRADPEWQGTLPQLCARRTSHKCSLEGDNTHAAKQ